MPVGESVITTFVGYAQNAAINVPEAPKLCIYLGWSAGFGTDFGYLPGDGQVEIGAVL